MCGRYVLYGPSSRYRDHFKIPDDGFDFTPRYNLAPSQAAPIVRADALGNRSILTALWGLIPTWAKVTEDLPRPINAKAETAAIKPMFRSAFRQRRVLVPVDAFYEWKKINGQNQPFLIHMKDGAPFGLGGLLEFWQGPAGEVATYTILTTAPNELMAAIHNRMPVIVRPEQYSEWLDPDVTDINRVHAMIGPYAGNFMEAYPVSTRVNSPLHEGPDLVVKIEIS